MGRGAIHLVLAFGLVTFLPDARGDTIFLNVDESRLAQIQEQIQPAAGYQDDQGRVYRPRGRRVAAVLRGVSRSTRRGDGGTAGRQAPATSHGRSVAAPDAR